MKTIHATVTDDDLSFLPYADHFFTSVASQVAYSLDRAEGGSGKQLGRHCKSNCGF
ncbi:MAG: hypothetical protein AAFR39_11205 [Pseudomonadota bacterium]